jgi:hypothetical protein
MHLDAAVILSSVLRFVCWEAALWAASIRLARAVSRRSRRAEEQWLLVLAIQVTLESSLAALLSFTRANSAAAYWTAAGVCALAAIAVPGGRDAFSRTAAAIGRLEIFEYPKSAALMAALCAPLVLLSFRPVEEIDSINYLHFLLEWMANRATPYLFTSGYVAFWELSFLPSWTITGVDLFFPLLALKAVVLLALAAWLAGREIGLRRGWLLWTVFGSILMRHFWYGYSGVPTLKNDALHGAGFLLLTLVVLRAVRRPLASADTVLLAFGATFALVKYSGVFLVAAALGAVLIGQRRALRRNPRHAAAVASAISTFVLLTTGHYYLRTLVEHGSPFYPYQINLGFLHLPGTGDLSNTSIFYSLHDPRLWRVLFLPASGVSPAGLLFPVVLGATLLLGTWRSVRAAARWLWHRRAPAVLDWAAFAILVGWIVYGRSVYSASAGPGDLAFLLNSLDNIRYVEGVLAMSELWLVALMAPIGWLAPALVAVNLGSRLLMLYAKVPFELFPAVVVVAIAVLAFLVFAGIGRLGTKRWGWPATLAAVACLVMFGPFVVERNRRQWTAYWNDLKPALALARGPNLAELEDPEGGYLAGHVVAAGNPVHSAVLGLSAEEIDAIPAGGRPRYLALLATPGPVAGAWRIRHGAELARWGYVPLVEGRNGALFEAGVRPLKPGPGAVLDAWFVPQGATAMPGRIIPSGHVLRQGDVVALSSGELVRFAPEGRQPLERTDGLRIRLLNCGPLDTGGKPGGVAYRWESGKWLLQDAIFGNPLPGPGRRLRPAIGEGRYREEWREGRDPFLRLSAENYAAFLAYIGQYPASLPDNTPVAIRAVVRCPKGCVLVAVGRLHSTERSVPGGGWSEARLDFVFRQAENPQYYSVGINQCRQGDWFDVRSFDLAPGLFPF